MRDNNLLKNVSALGYPLFGPEDGLNANLTLAQVVKSRDLWSDRLFKAFSNEKKKEFNTFFNKLKDNDEFQCAGRTMSSQRLKSVFSNYFNQAQKRLENLLSVKDELGLEYALSQVFSPKQKELFYKKLKREKLTKTESEYFSRVVKKKVSALANNELCRLSQKLLEQA